MVARATEQKVSRRRAAGLDKIKDLSNNVRALSLDVVFFLTVRPWYFFEVVNHKETRNPSTLFWGLFGAIYKHNGLTMVYGNLLREKAQGRA